MKAKVKEGSEYLFMPGNHFDNIANIMIINFREKETYDFFKQKKNHLLIFTKNGYIDIVFTGNIPVLQFDSYCKDQLILTVNKKV